MKRITENRYIKRNVTKDWLKQNNFHYSRIYSDIETEAYTYRFPVYKYNAKVILECELVLYEDTGEVKINVYDNNYNSKCAAFYCESNVYNKFVSKIEKKIKNEIRKLGIQKIKIREEENNKR